MTIDYLQKTRDRLFAGVTIDPKQCWLWQRAKFKDGYGMTYFDSGLTRAHRASFWVWKRPIKDGEQILHKCNVKSCINPKHLYAGTHLQNMADLRRSGVLAGEGNPKAKLSNTDIRKIRRAYINLIGELSQRYGVNRQSIRNVMHYTTWNGND